MAATLALVVSLGAGCSGSESDSQPALENGAVQCPGSVVRRVDGGEPLADALPNVEEAITDQAAAKAAFDLDRATLADRYSATSVELGDGFGRAWRGENGGDFEVADVDDWGVVITLSSPESCPEDSDLHVASANGLPLFFFAPQ